jgi:hypothetical protein
MTEEDLADYLEGSGYPAHLVRGGSQGLIARYKKFVEEVEHGYPYGLDDYRRDLDLRGVIETAELSGEVAEEDARLEEMLVCREVRVWESLPGNPNWDFGFPRNAPRDLLRGLKSSGLLPDEGTA